MSIFKREKIESFEIITLRESGMRHVSEYEIVDKDGKAELSLYAIGFEQNEKKRILKNRVLCDKSEIIKLLNDCRVISWDGFYGKHPRGVRDGTMFDFHAAVNGNKTISASGSQNFPKGYLIFTDKLYSLLNP